MEKFWREKGIVEKALWKKGERGKFFFLDGPPFVTNPIHIGTAWNKILKDAILRYKRMMGSTVWAQPGYDTHGLPIEVMVEKNLGITRKRQILEEIGLERFNAECRKLVDKHIEILSDQFRSLGVWMDWENAYATLRDPYISSVWWAIKEAYEKGLLDEDLRVFHWCPRCETVLSDHEVAQEYGDIESPSIYVKFPLVGEENEYLLIWTTTPWTLPSNVGVMVNPKIRYVRIRLEDTGETFILAEKRVRDVIAEKYQILDEFDGSSLENLRYRSPLETIVPLQRDVTEGHRVVLSVEYVSEEEGTGCVHVAPEHGREDFEVSRRSGLPHIAIVDEEGRFMEGAGKYGGKNVFEADEEIIADLRALNMIYREEKLVHRYPNCWRCKTPLILKSTRQWILKLSTLKEELIGENEKIRWVPEWAGAQRFRNWIEQTRDWVISRQRFWGTPFPVWQCDKCGNIEVIGSKRELEEKIGAKISNLHRPHIDEITWRCGCGGLKKRLPHVLDCWVDSGAASWASLGYPDIKEKYEELWPVDFITEGHDQTRGWFYSLLALGLIAFNCSPYQTVLMHGFTLDAHGRGMHKSLGNVIYPEEVVERYGRDAVRVFLLKNTVWVDVIVSDKEIERTSRDLDIVLNVYDFYSTYAKMDGFKSDLYDVEEAYERLMEEDKWILSRFEGALQRASGDMERYHVHSAVRELLRFIIDDLSRRYVKMVRRRVWIEEESWEKTAVYITLHHILRKLALTLAPFAPYLSEHFYQNYIGKFEDAPWESVHLGDWPKFEARMIDEELEKRYDMLWRMISTVYAIRQRRGVKIRQPFEELLIPNEALASLSDRMTHILGEQSNVLHVRGISASEEEKLVQYRVRGKTALLGPKHRDKTGRIIQAISAIEPKSLVEEMREKGSIALDIDGEEAEVYAEEVDIMEEALEPYASDKVGDRRIFLNMGLTGRLLALGVVRDLVRMTQEMRKRMNLEMMEMIDVAVEAGDEKIVEAIESHLEYIKREARVKNVLFDVARIAPDYEEEWEINGTPVKIGIKRLKRR